MRARSRIWQKLAARGRFSVQTKAIIDGKEYVQISAPKISRQSMPSVLSIGNCCNASLELNVLLEEGEVIPEGAEIVIKSRLYEGDDEDGKVSEWLPFGTFYIDHRDDEYEGLVKITAFDAMLKASQKFVADDNFNTYGWPKPMKDVVEYIADRLGVGVDPRTCIKTGNDYKIPLPSEYTVMQVLGYIAQCHGGNWIITEENMLRLVPLVQIPSDSFKIISADFEDIIVPPEHNLVWKHPTEAGLADLTTNSVAKVAITSKAARKYHIVDEEGKHIVTRDGYTLVWAKDGDLYAVNGIIRVPVVKGKLSTSPSITVSNVIASQTKTVLVTGEESDSASEQAITSSFQATKGNAAGETLNAGDCPYMTQQICDDLFTEYNGLVYAPYTATSAVYDPAVEIGDQIKIGGKVSSVIYNENIVLNTGFSADLVLPAKDESVKSEYKYNPEGAKLQDLIKSVRTSITRLDNSIQLKIDRLSEETDGKYDAVIEMFADYTKTGDLITQINMSADVISLKSGRLQITSGNFLLDKDGNVTVKNGTFQGTVKTGTSSEGSGATLGNGTLKLQYNDTDFLSIYAGAWGAGSGHPVTGGIMKCENYLAFLDESSNFYFAINTGGNPAGWTDDLLFFGTSYFNNDITVKSTASINLGGNTLSFSGNYVDFSGGIQATNIFFEDAPCSGTSSKSLSAILAYLERKIG